MSTQSFYRMVMDRSEKANLDAAKQATAAVFHTLRDRLTPDEADQVVDQLPQELKAVWEEGDELERSPVKMHRDQFLGRVRREAGLESIEEAQAATLAVFAALKRHISPGEAGDVGDQLPKDLKEMWAEAAPHA
jgi:uncharacterized protein (DUF2267 family)